MLVFQLLPYFLAAQLNTNETFKYGPKYYFSGHLKMLTSLDEDKGKFLGTSLHFRLDCQPREPDILRCQIAEKPYINRIISQTFDIKYAEDDKNDTSRVFNLCYKNFEIKFNNKGIDSYILDGTKPLITWCSNVMRLIANQLSVGIDLSDEMKETHRALENFTIGECNVDYKITRKMPMNENKLTRQFDFELLPLEKIEKFPDESVEVVKKRDVKNCLRYREPFIGIRYARGLIRRGAIMKLLSSESNIYISKYNFISETTNENEVYDDNRKKLGKVLDNVKLTLDYVFPASEELPKIDNLVYVDLLADKLESNDSNSSANITKN